MSHKAAEEDVSEALQGVDGHERQEVKGDRGREVNDMSVLVEKGEGGMCRKVGYECG